MKKINVKTGEFIINTVAIITTLTAIYFSILIFN
jgi:hypothetical protein